MAEKVWERSARKLFVLVLRAEGLPQRGDHEPDCSCRLFLGKEERSTAVVKRSASPVWEELFLFELGPEGGIGALRLEVREEKTFGGGVLGSWFLASPELLTPDEPHDRTVDLTPRPGKKDPGGGRVILRILYSTDVERLRAEAAPEAPPTDVFSYEEHAGSFKTGDLIAYSAPGVVAASLKLWSGSPFDRLGLILALPNRWTERFELYVWEFTRNIDQLVDAFHDQKRPGCNLFRLFDRLHQFHGSAIAWSALRTPLDRFAGQRLVEYTWAQHTGAQPFTNPEVDPESPLMRFFHRLGINARKAPPPELHSAHALAGALRCASLMPAVAEGAQQASILTAKDIISLPAYLPPRILRSRPSGPPASVASIFSTPPASAPALSPPPASSSSSSPVAAPASPRPSSAIAIAAPPATTLPATVISSSPNSVSPRPSKSTYSAAPQGPPPAYTAPSYSPHRSSHKGSSSYHHSRHASSTASSAPPADYAAPPPRPSIAIALAPDYSSPPPPPSQPDVSAPPPRPSVASIDYSMPPPAPSYAHLNYPSAPPTYAQATASTTEPPPPYESSLHPFAPPPSTAYVPIRLNVGPPPAYTPPPPPASVSAALAALSAGNGSGTLGEDALEAYLRNEQLQQQSQQQSKPRAHGMPPPK